MKQIVINVPDEWLEGAPPNLYDVMGAMMNGTPLPEYHSKPLDSVLDEIMAEIQENVNYNKRMDYLGIVAGLLLALDIIDKYKK